MNLGYEGEVALVAASSKGLGRATAHAIAAEGASVMLTSRDEETLKQTATEIREATGSKVSYEPADLTRPEDISRLLERTRRELGPVSVLVTNSGGPPAGRFDILEDEAWQGAFDLNLMSAVRLIRETLPHMRERGYGRIVNLTSSSIQQPIDGLLLSNVFRVGVLGLSKSLSVELASEGILVNTLGPGRIHTDRVDSLDQGRADREGITREEVREKSEATIPLGRYGEPKEFGQVAAFLASPANTYVTGQALLTDGGMVKAL
jgi:3-oxoacyl-[acyl-carrier protein] reductase